MPIENKAVKTLFVFGTRPEAIKLAPLILESRATPGMDVRLCVTAQHRQMLDQVLAAFDLEADYDFDLMKAKQDLFDITAQCLLSLRPVLSAEQPVWVVVQGDTTTTLAGALAAYYSKCRVAHVEAGLRTYQKNSPFPEEINRRLTTQLADVHFAPTERARQALLAEGVSQNDVHVTGNTVIDALLKTCQKYGSEWPPVPGMRPVPPARKLILVTGHRRESFGPGLASICRALAELATRRQDVEIVYAVHMNPNVAVPVQKSLGGLERVQLIEPVSYVPFVGLMKAAHLILTDSGGIQEEGPSLGKPVLVTRDVTERPEAVDAGTVRLVGTQAETIVAGVELLLDDRAAYQQMSQAHNPYGDGQASRRIVDVLLQKSSQGDHR